MPFARFLSQNQGFPWFQHSKSHGLGFPAVFAPLSSWNHHYLVSVTPRSCISLRLPARLAGCAFTLPVPGWLLINSADWHLHTDLCLCWAFLQPGSRGKPFHFKRFGVFTFRVPACKTHECLRKCHYICFPFLKSAPLMGALKTAVVVVCLEPPQFVTSCDVTAVPLTWIPSCAFYLGFDSKRFSKIFMRK